MTPAIAHPSGILMAPNDMNKDAAQKTNLSYPDDVAAIEEENNLPRSQPASLKTTVLYPSPKTCGSSVVNTIDNSRLPENSTISANTTIERSQTTSDFVAFGYPYLPSNRSSPTSNKENKTRHSSGSAQPRLIQNSAIEEITHIAPEYNVVAVPISTTPTPATIEPRLKIKLRGIQAALKDPLFHSRNPSSFSKDKPGKTMNNHTTAGRKRTFAEIVTHDADDTDSEIELVPSKPRYKKTTSTMAKKQVTEDTLVKTKKMKAMHRIVTHENDAMFDAGDEAEPPDNGVCSQLSLVTPIMKRNKRILNPSNPEHAQLLGSATKIGSEYYDSDADDLPGDVKDTNKPHLFRNVRWGSYATDFDNAAEFAKEPEFTQFVPGRFELLPDGTVADQKAKLIIKLTDKTGRKRIFANPPPRDWNNQDAITALNKRTAQQIRRNTDVRFREVVHAYVPEERRWILANLTAGKPTKGWKSFVENFNQRFEGTSVQGVAGYRPYRSHSSLTKEVERFGAQYYVKGLVPMPAKKGKKD
ncbi:hypothetical protein BKA66DRAFT_554510 [Pyrenochaeta sp. MPI-SDFR-AT-0127]|nr:hypothetical protein BKA66DRAFT_554510 [Pyrenochaeta sp. MPI-SDFR-AT-0127]